MKKSEKNSSKDRSFFDDLKIFETIFLSKPEFSDLRVNIFVDPKHHRYPGYRWFAGRNSFVIEKLGGTVGSYHANYQLNLFRGSAALHVVLECCRVSVLTIDLILSTERVIMQNFRSIR